MITKMSKIEENFYVILPLSITELGVGEVGGEVIVVVAVAVKV